MDTPFCSFIDIVRRDDEQETLRNAMDFLKEFTSSFETNIKEWVSSHLLDVRTKCDHLDAKVSGTITHRFDPIIDTVRTIDRRLDSYVQQHFTKIRETVERFDTRATTEDVTFQEGKRNVQKVDEGIERTEPKQETTVARTIVDYFPLIIGEVPAQPKWKGRWGLCKKPGKYNGEFVVIPVISFCPDGYIDAGLGDFATQQDAVGRARQWIKDAVDRFDKLGSGSLLIDDPKHEIILRDREEAVEGAGGGFALAAVDWSAVDICGTIKAIKEALADKDIDSAAKALGLRWANGNPATPQWFAKLINDIPILPNWITKGGADVLRVVVDVIDAITLQTAQKLPCNPAKSAGQYAALMINSLLDKYLGFKIPKLEQNIQYQLDLACPERLPSSAEADNMYLGNEIDWNKWQCLVSANNDIWQHKWPGILASRAKPTALDYIRYAARGKLDDKGLEDKLRGLGWLFPKDTEVIKELAWEYPSPSDLITFMLRDVFDKTVIDQFGYADEFKSKFSGKAKELFTAAGVKEEIALLQWMAHWKNPSNTQLFEMYHRNRGGNKKIGQFRYYDKDGNKLAQPIELTQDDIKVSEADVARAIGINDVLPFWRDRLLAISRPPLTRVDVRRAYDIDSIGENQVYESYRDLGYDDEKAKTLTKFATDLKKRGDVRRKGFMLPSRISSLYKRGGLNNGEAKEMLIQSGLRPDDAEANLRQADKEVAAVSRIECVKALEKRFMTGDIDGSTLVTLLGKQGVELLHANAIRKRLECKLSLKTKEVTASMLCQWYERSLISKEDYFKRLVRIGYSEEDAGRIVQACHLAGFDKAVNAGEKGKQYSQDKEYVPPDNRELGSVPNTKEKKGKRK